MRSSTDHPDASLEFEPFDLADLSTVRAGAAAILARHPSISILVNNAGVMFTPEGKTADGFETQFGTNHLGHFVLTNQLMPALLAGAPSRIVNLSSAGHGFSDILWDDPNYETRPYDKFEAYGQSKTANILFTIGLEARHAASGVRSNAVHPGMIMTDLARHMGEGDMEELGARAAQREASGNGGGLPDFKTVEQGAATSVFAAVVAESRRESVAAISTMSNSASPRVGDRRRRRPSACGRCRSRWSASRSEGARRSGWLDRGGPALVCRVPGGSTAHARGVAPATVVDQLRHRHAADRAVVALGLAERDRRRDRHVVGKGQQFAELVFDEGVPDREHAAVPQAAGGEQQVLAGRIDRCALGRVGRADSGRSTGARGRGRRPCGRRSAPSSAPCGPWASRGRCPSPCRIPRSPVWRPRRRGRRAR